jgi:hypothetical protein
MVYVEMKLRNAGKETLTENTNIQMAIGQAKLPLPVPQPALGKGPSGLSLLVNQHNLAGLSPVVA